jgi:hypothetical protein
MGTVLEIFLHQNMFLVLFALTPLSWSIETVNMGIMQVVFPRGGLVGSAIATSLLYTE